MNKDLKDLLTNPMAIGFLCFPLAVVASAIVGLVTHSTDYMMATVVTGFTIGVIFIFGVSSYWKPQE